MKGIPAFPLLKKKRFETGEKRSEIGEDTVVMLRVAALCAGRARAPVCRRLSAAVSGGSTEAAVALAFADSLERLRPSGDQRADESKCVCFSIYLDRSSTCVHVVIFRRKTHSREIVGCTILAKGLARSLRFVVIKHRKHAILQVPRICSFPRWTRTQTLVWLSRFDRLNRACAK